MARSRASKPSAIQQITRTLRTNASYLAKNGAAYTVFGVAAWQSYWHIVSLATRYQPHDPAPLLPTAYLLPLSIDGVMLVSSKYLHAPTRPRRALAALAFGLGVLGTLLANVFSAPPTLGARILAAAPAVGMILTAGILHANKRPAPRAPRASRTRATQRNVNSTAPATA